MEGGGLARLGDDGASAQEDDHQVDHRVRQLAPHDRLDRDSECGVGRDDALLDRHGEQRARCPPATKRTRLLGPDARFDGRGALALSGLCAQLRA